jgi:hypothetical protein
MTNDCSVPAGLGIELNFTSKIILVILSPDRLRAQLPLICPLSPWNLFQSRYQMIRHHRLKME